MPANVKDFNLTFPHSLSVKDFSNGNVADVFGLAAVQAADRFPQLVYVVHRG
jgi:hypothetical protein